VIEGQTTSFAWAINDNGKVVGYSGNRAASWDAGVVTDLGPGSARDINSSGAMLVNNTVITGSGTLGLTGVSGATYIYASVLNDNGVVAGYASGDRIVIWENGLPTVLGQYGYVPSPSGINNLAEIVGSMRVGRAWRWSPETGFAYLDDLGFFTGWELLGATGINESGQIVGTGRFGGQTTAFLLTPVPEPRMGIALIAAFIVLTGWRARTRSTGRQNAAAVED